MIMNYRKFREGEFNISELGYGCWQLGGPRVWNGSNDEDGIRAVHAAIDCGINFFDVAPVYGFGHSEQVLGRALKGKRDTVYVASKCGLIWDDKYNIRNCLKPKSIFEEIDRSLKRLDMDYIDIYQLHWPDPNTPLDETLEAIVKIRDSGKIRNFGFSNFSLEDAQRGLNYGVVSQQCLYNMFDRNSSGYHGIELLYNSEAEMIPWCAKHEVIFIPYSPMCQGLLSDMTVEQFNAKKNDIRSANPRFSGREFDKLVAVRGRLMDIAQEIGKPLSQVAVSWILRFDSMGPVIFGSLNPRNIQENAAASEYRLTDDILMRINDQLDLI